MRPFFPLRPVDLRSVFRETFSVCCPEVGQTEPPPALAFSSVGRGVSAGQLASPGQHTKKNLKTDLRSTSNGIKKKGLGSVRKKRPGAGAALGWVSRRLAVVCLRQCRPECSFLELKKWHTTKTKKKIDLRRCAAATAAAARHRSPQWRKHARLHGSYARAGGGSARWGSRRHSSAAIAPTASGVIRLSTRRTERVLASD